MLHVQDLTLVVNMFIPWCTHHGVCTSYWSFSIPSASNFQILL